MSEFRLKKLSLACSVALAAVGSVCSVSTQAQTVELFFAGDTGKNHPLWDAARNLCGDPIPGIEISLEQMPGGIMRRCMAGASSGVPGQVIQISTTAVGGSANGVVAVNNAVALPRPATATFPGCTLIVDPFWPGQAYICPAGGATNQVPHAGLTDVEPRLLGTPAQIGNLTSAGTMAVQHALVLSTELYQKLQAEQGKIVGDFSEAQSPNLRAGELRGILTGTITDWSQLYPAITPSPVAAGVTTAVKLCRQGPASSTQKAFEVRMVGTGCAGASTADSGALNVTMSNTTDDFPGNGTTISTGTASGQGGYRGRTDVYTVVVNSSDADVIACVAAANAQGELALGQLNGKSVKILDTNPAMKLVKLGNVFPNTANLVNGNWDNLWTQATFNRRAAGTYTADQLAVMNAIQAGMSNVANIAAAALPGLAALPSNGNVWDGIQPIVREERRTAGGDINNCQDTLFQ